MRMPCANSPRRARPGHHLTSAVLAVMLIAGQPHAASAASQTDFDKLVMNGIRFSDYIGFEERWPQVTVRFRTDSGELRFTYANTLAYDALKAGGKTYPDGAVFAKIGAMSQDDPEFLSSKIPAGAVRFQFMVRDQKKYADTGGWGYALFTAGDAMPLDKERDTINACFACHELVKDSRAYVFSQLAPLSSRVGPHAAPPAVPVAAPFTFTKGPVSLLPKAARAGVPADTTVVWYLQGDLRKHVFEGTIGELRPTLLAEAVKRQQPVAFLGENSPRFLVVAKVQQPTSGGFAPKCSDTQELYASSSIVIAPGSEQDAKQVENSPLIKRYSCERRP